MRKTADYGFEFQGSTMHLRVWEGENPQEKPYVVVEPGRGVPFEENRVALASELAGTIGISVPDLNWYEQSADGTMKRFDFNPYEFQHLPGESNMRPGEAEKAIKDGLLTPDTIKGFHTSSEPVTAVLKEFVESWVGERIDSYEQRQNQEFQNMEMPKIDIDR